MDKNGWTYSLSNLDITLNEDRVIHETCTKRTGPVYNRDVTLTVPNGQRVTFSSRYDNTYNLTYDIIPGGSGVKSFTANGQNRLMVGTLAAEGYPHWSNHTPEYREYLDHAYECVAAYDVSGYTMTMDDGTEYHIARYPYPSQTIQAPILDDSVGDSIGDILDVLQTIYTYTPYGKPYLSFIVLPSGETIKFVVDVEEELKVPGSYPNADPEAPKTVGVKLIPEDEQEENIEDIIKLFHDEGGRIIAVYAPGEAANLPTAGYPNLYDYRDAGIPTVKYYYDDFGNLTEVGRLVDASASTDTEQYEITTYEYEDAVYNPSDHYVTAIKDERDLAPIRYEYDGEGRLIGTIDAKGNRIAIKHNILGSDKTEIVTDRTGRTTVYGYNSRGNVTYIQKLNRQGGIIEEVEYQYNDVNYQDAPNYVINSVPDYLNEGFIESITETRYDSLGRSILTIDPVGNATETYYDDLGNIVKSIQWKPSGTNPNFAGDSQPFIITDYSAVIITENTYFSGSLLKTTETRDDTKWYSMSITLYDGQNRVTDSIQIDADGITSDNIDDFRSINSIEDDEDGNPNNDLVNFSGNHVITSYWYDQALSSSADQPYSVSEPYSMTELSPDSDHVPAFHQFTCYDLNNRQVANWSVWDDPATPSAENIRVLNINEMDAQGRNTRSIHIVDDNVQTLDFILDHVDDYIENDLGVREAVIQSVTEYNKIGKVWKSESPHVPHESGPLTVYAYDEVGNLVETRTYAAASNYNQANPNSHVLTISRTLYDAEGRTLVSVGPYAMGDEPVGTEYFYDELGRTVETVRWADVRIPLVNLYDADGEIAGLRLPAGVKPANAWDGSQSRPENIGWTANGGSLPTIGEELSYSRTVYDAAGRVQISVTLDEDGFEQPTSYEYDVAGRQTAVIDPLGHEINRGADEKTISSVILNSTHRTETHYDGTRRDYVIDARGFEDGAEPADFTTSFIYDAVGRTVTTVHPPTLLDGGIEPVTTYTHIGYDSLGRKAWDSDPVTISRTQLDAMKANADPTDFNAFLANHTKQYTYDTAGRLIQVILPQVPDPEDLDVNDDPIIKNPIYDYFYDDSGNQVGILDPKGRLTVFKYDEQGRQRVKYMPFVTTNPLPENILMADDVYAALSNANPADEYWNYDEFGRLEVHLDYKEQAIRYIYNGYGQLDYKVYYDADADTTDGVNNYCAADATDFGDDVESYTRLTEKIYYTYDNLGRQVTETVTDYRSGSPVTTYSAGTVYDAEGRIDSIITQNGDVAEYQCVDYDYHPITGQKTAVKVLSSPDGQNFTLDDQTDYTYDSLGRLGTIQPAIRSGTAVTGEVTAYGYTAVGSRRFIEIDTDGNAGWELKTSYTYNGLNRLTALVNEKIGSTVLSSFSYSLAADGMRKQAIEYIEKTSGADDHTVNYGYDNLNRLESEIVGESYSITYTYDLSGNRKSRSVVGCNGTLDTTYYYDPDTDRLLTEVHEGPVATVGWVDDRPITLYASADGGTYYNLPGSKRKIGHLEGWFYGLPSIFSRYILAVLATVTLAVLLGPPSAVLYRRMRKLPRRERPRLSIWHRTLCLLLAWVFLVGPEVFQQAAYADSQYTQVSTFTWADGNQTIEYGYDANGSLTSKVTYQHVDQNLVFVKGLRYAYSLQNRLAEIWDLGTDEISTVDDELLTEYRYDPSGIRTAKIDYEASPAQLTAYLIDPANHTGYAQVLQETTFQDDGQSGWTPLSRIDYTIGDDVLAQTTSTYSGGWSAGSTKYLLYDGHGSTRQLAAADQSIRQNYNYDAYGTLLQETGAESSPGITPKQDTSLLYAGEQFDTNNQMYYNRARYYNPLNGLFSQVDPYAGNTQDPQSLHKYAYCHNNPVNAKDPTGMFSLISVMTTMFNIGRAFIKLYPILKWGLVVDDILTLTRIALKVIEGGISSVSAWEWAEFALITSTIFFGGKVVRNLAKNLIRRALGVPVAALKSFKGLKRFIESKGVIVKLSKLANLKGGFQILGEFDFIQQGGLTKPIIYLFEGGHNLKVLIHEFVHVRQWETYVGFASREDWMNFLRIKEYDKYTEAVAHFVSDVFAK